ncbi:hypothetical protein D3C86_1695080 [compost metagenome]
MPAVTIIFKPEFTPNVESKAKPIAPITRPIAITNAGLNFFTNLGTSSEPPIKAKKVGSNHNPASIADNPNTNCRYCEVKKKEPNIKKPPKL